MGLLRNIDLCFWVEEVKLRFSNINFKNGESFEFFHNDRTRDTIHSIFSKENNEYSTSGDKAYRQYKEDLKRFKELYKKQQGRKLPKTTVTLLSAIMNLDERHHLDDVKKVAEFLENYLGTKVYQIAIHRDEGYVDKEGNPHINHHAHLLMSGLKEENGIVKSIKKRLKKADLFYIQDKVAEILNMPRSLVKSKKRLDTNEYKEFVQKNKDLVEANHRLKEENFYLNKELNFYMQETIKKDKEIEKLKEYLNEIKENNKLLKNDLDEYKKRYEMLYQKALRIIKKLRDKYLRLKKEKELKKMEIKKGLKK